MIRIGFDEKDNNIPFHYFKRIPGVIRNIPDYVFVIGDKCRLIEIKGFTRKVKIKIEDLLSYQSWDNLCDLVFFFYSPVLQEIYYLTYKQVVFLLREDIKFGKYEDNKKTYMEIEVKHLKKY